MDPSNVIASPARAIAQCWVAHALQAVAHRMRNQPLSECAEPQRMDVYVVASSIDANGSPGVLASILHALLAQDELNHETNACTVHSIQQVDDLLPVDVSPGSSVRVVCFEISDDIDEWCTMDRLISASTASIPIALVGYHVRKGSIRVSGHASEASKASLRTPLAPLYELQDQCGLPIALELLGKLQALSATDRKATGDVKSVPASMMQLSFQLLLMLLRWTYFHPAVVELVLKPLTRKLGLIPQRRVQEELVSLYTRHHQLWRSVYPDTGVLLNPPLQQTSRRLRLPSIDADADNDDDQPLPPLERLSHCALWDQQKEFYRTQGIKAWSNGLIPFGVSSSSYLAMQYAKLAVDFLRLHAAAMVPPLRPTTSSEERSPNCFVWEAASGSCKFLHSFLVHFYDLVEQEQLETRLGIVPCVVASDLSQQVLESREAMATFQQFVADRRLDFAHFDTDSLLRGRAQADSIMASPRHHLYLRNAQRWWHVGHDGGPVFIIGNYFLDSLRTDVFVVTQQRETREIQVREAVIDPTTDSMPDMLFQLKKVVAHPRATPVYSHTAVNAALVTVLDHLEAEWSQQPQSTGEGAESDIVNSSLVLFPTEAIAFLDAVLCNNRFPVAVITGDATVSFKDAVPRSFIDYDSGDLMVPQLSPHPDCFCLPVDLGVLKLFASSSSIGSGAVVATPGSDTFNVFFAHSQSQQQPSIISTLEHRFLAIFSQFTPCDCDLLWGMMSEDAGANHLSFDSLIALLSQTAFDFDVFVVIQWPLLRLYRKSITEQELSPYERQRMQSQLLLAATNSIRTRYVLDEDASTDTTSIAMLQHARWLFGLGACRDAVAVLSSLEHTGYMGRATLYLLGLACFCLEEYWAALAWFRKAQQLEPDRLRLKKWVARALLCLQREKQRAHDSE